MADPITFRETFIRGANRFSDLALDVLQSVCYMTASSAIEAAIDRDLMNPCAEGATIRIVAVEAVHLKEDILQDVFGFNCRTYHEVGGAVHEVLVLLEQLTEGLFISDLAPAVQESCRLPACRLLRSECINNGTQPRLRKFT